MDKQTGPKGCLVVLPGEIIEIPQGQRQIMADAVLQLAARACGEMETSL